MPSTPKAPPAKNTKKPATSTGKPASAPSTPGIDLAQLFGAAAQALTASQGTLNQADTANGTHGDNMVKTFQLITQAVSATQGKPPAQQLANASKMLADHSATSGSAKIYAQGLSQAAQQVRGQKSISTEMALGLVQTLLGGGQTQTSQQPAVGADLLGQLLGGMQQQPSGGQPSQPAAGADLLGQLLGGMQQQLNGGQPSQPAAGADLLGQLLGGTQQQPSSGGSQSGLDVGDLLNAGMAFMQAKQSGQDNVQAAVSALVSASPLSQTPHRQQSGEVVASALFQAISMFSKK